MLRKELKHGDMFVYNTDPERVKIVDDGGQLRDSGLQRSKTKFSVRLDSKVTLLAPVIESAAPAAQQPAVQDDALDPGHYKNLNPEPILVAEGWGLDRNLSSVIWYIARAGRKEPGADGLIRDLKKARRFLTRAINLAGGQADWLYRE